MKLFLSGMLVLASTILPGFATAELQDFSGKPSEISAFVGNGKWTTVIIWRSDCHACNVEAEQYIQFHEAYKDKHIQMLGISMDGQKELDAAKAFIKRHGVTYPNLIGEFEEVATMYEIISGGPWVGTPTILVYDPKGELLAAQPGAVPPEFIEEFIEQKLAETAAKK